MLKDVLWFILWCWIGVTLTLCSTVPMKCFEKWELFIFPFVIFIAIPFMIIDLAWEWIKDQYFWYKGF